MLQLEFKVTWTYLDPRSLPAYKDRFQEVDRQYDRPFGHRDHLDPDCEAPSEGRRHHRDDGEHYRPRPRLPILNPSTSLLLSTGWTILLVNDPNRVF